MVLKAWISQFHYHLQPTTLYEFVDEARRRELTREELPVRGHEMVPLLMQSLTNAEAAFALARRWWIVLLLTTGAVAFSAYLTYVEAWLLETYCIWCVVSAAIISVTEIAAIVALVRSRRRSTAEFEI